MEFRPAGAALGALHPVLAFGWKFKGGATAVIPSREGMERAQRGSPSSACLSLRGARAIGFRARPGRWAGPSRQRERAWGEAGERRGHEQDVRARGGSLRVGVESRGEVCRVLARVPDGRATPGRFQGCTAPREGCRSNRGSGTEDGLFGAGGRCSGGRRLKGAMVIREDQDEQLSGEKQRGVECQTGAPCPARRSLALAKQEAQCAATAPQITANRRSPAREPGLPLHALRASVGASAGCVLLRVPPAAQSCVPCAALLLHSTRSPHPPAQHKSRACCLTRTGLTLSSAATAELRPGARAVRGGKWCELHSLAISPPKSRAPRTACSRTFTFTLLLLCPGLAPSLCLPVHSARFVPSHHHHACSRRWWHGRSVDLRQACVRQLLRSASSLLTIC